MKNNIERLINENSVIIEQSLKQYLLKNNSNGLIDIMEYSLMSGGKRIRPFIVIEAYKLFSGKSDVKRALPYASALEMIHTYSLIHDDLPAMDNDDYRRGKLTNHKVYGEAKALLAGDSLLTFAFEVLASNEYVSDKSVRLATLALAKYAGYNGMAGGQMLDLDSAKAINSYPELKNMHSLKTGALIKCAMILGYLAFTDMPENDVIEDITEYAENVGVAFQIRDDILDKISSIDDLGKPVGSDAKNGKTTSLSYMSVDEAEKEVTRLTEQAINSIDKYCIKNNNKTLIDLALYMVNRKK